MNAQDIAVHRPCRRKCVFTLHQEHLGTVTDHVRPTGLWAGTQPVAAAILSEDVAGVDEFHFADRLGCRVVTVIRLAA